jgi:hypothetical protein
VADIFRRFGARWRAANEGHISLAQRRVMTAIEVCRTAALGGHVECCENCAHTRVAYNSCRNRHCPKCQWAAAQAWQEAREAEVLPVPYFHVVFTLPAALRGIAYHNKAKVYGLLFKVAAETLITIAGDPKHLGAEMGILSVLHTWGSALTHHPHIHMIVPGGGLSPDRSRWIACRPGFFLPVRVLSRLFCRLFLEGLVRLHADGELQFFGELAAFTDARALHAYLAPLRKSKWVVNVKELPVGPEEAIRYFARYTHRVAISNSRIVDVDEEHVAFRWKDYRENGRYRAKVMQLGIDEFIRRFLLHVLPDGFHRVRHYGLFANGHRAENLELCRKLLRAPPSPVESMSEDGAEQCEMRELPPCPCCGGRMRVTGFFDGPMSRPYYARRMDTS